MTHAEIARSLSPAQRRALACPKPLIIENHVAMYLGETWPEGMFCYEYPYYGLLSEIGLAVRAIIEEENAR